MVAKYVSCLQKVICVVLYGHERSLPICTMAARNDIITTGCLILAFSYYVPIIPSQTVIPDA